MNESDVEPHRITLSRWDSASSPVFHTGDTLHLEVGLPCHGSSSHAWDLFHDLACAVWLARALAPHARVVDAELSEGHLAITLTLVVAVSDPEGLRTVFSQAHPLWSDDEALDAEREAADCEVFDLIEEIEPGDLDDLPAWLSAHYFRWRDTAREVASQG